MNAILPGGICISSFLIITPKKGGRDSVLVGRINKTAAWDHLAGMNDERREKNSRGWMLPSSHLLLFETAEEAADRVAREQLGVQGLELDGPFVFSEAYGSPDKHWDFEFLFLGSLEDVMKPNDAWSELKFAKVRDMKREEFVRLHEDIIDLYLGKLIDDHKQT
jgi:ADP-ribose pyrophosphatase YjhB (NUDIX family)